MISFIIWIIGVVLTIKAAMDIWQLSGDKVKKILFIAVIVLTSWLSGLNKPATRQKNKRVTVSWPPSFSISSITLVLEFGAKELPVKTCDM